MMHMIRTSALIACLVLLPACRSNRPVENDLPEGVYHVVLCWLKQPRDEAARRQIIDSSHGFVGVIPGLVGVRAGTSLASNRPIVDTTYDVAIVMVFRDERALDAYDLHPAHKKAGERVLRPLTAKVLIYDFASP